MLSSGTFSGGYYAVAHLMVDIISWHIEWWILSSGTFNGGYYPVAHLMVDIIRWHV